MTQLPKTIKTAKVIEDKLVSIIIVNWNGMKWLKKCLDSLHKQTYKNYEIIFVDNNSSDDSVNYVQLNYKSVRIVKSGTNLGFAGGNNLGIENAHGDLIMLLNNDTWVEPNFLADLVENFHKNACDIIAPQESTYADMKALLKSVTIDPFGYPVFDSSNKRPNFYLQGACLLFRKSLYIDTGGLDDNFFMYFEETDWFWRLQLLGKKIVHDPGISFYHAGAGSAGGGLSVITFQWRNENILQMLLKNYEKTTLMWVLPVYLLQNILEACFFLIILKPKIALTYAQGIKFNVRNIKRTMQKREWVQANRVISDTDIFKKMFFGSGKLIHLTEFYKL